MNVNSCDKCQKKFSLPTQASLLITPCGRSLQMMQVDVLEVSLSLEGNRYLLVVALGYIFIFKMVRSLSNEKSKIGNYHYSINSNILQVGYSRMYSL